MSLPIRIAEQFARMPEVMSVALAGSQTGLESDALSDFDFYVYSDLEPPLHLREQIARTFADRIQCGNRVWEPGDEWIDRQTGRAVDVMFRSPAWIEDQLDRVLVRHEASAGYSTCFWWNFLKSHCLFDRDRWFTDLQERAAAPYPEPLRQAIIAKNLPLLSETLSSYRAQIDRAQLRNDRVSVNHRVAAFLASYFDILFAWNRTPHPGEKRLLAYASHLCPECPSRMEEHVAGLLSATDCLPWVDELAEGIHRLVENSVGLHLKTD